MAITPATGGVLRRLLLAAACLFAAGHASASDCIASKPVAFDVFMNHGLPMSVPLTLLVPSGFEYADMGMENRAYWMPAAVVAKVRESGDLPVDTGFMYGKVSLDVGYDVGRKAFVGIDGFEEAARAAGLELSGTEEGRANGHALLFFEVIEPATNKPAYGAYIATGRDIVVYVAWRPLGNDRAVGDCFWKDFKRALMQTD